MTNWPQYITKSSLFSPHSCTKLYYLSIFCILSTFNPMYIMPKSCKKSLRIEAKATDFTPLNHILRLIFIHIIQSFLYTICTNCTKIHTKKQSRKSGEKAFLILSILIDFSTPQTRNDIPSRAKIRYNRNLKHIKYFYKYQPQNHSAHSHKI